MSVGNPSLRRNVVLVGQGGVGKTALAESILFACSVTTRVGKTLEGSSHFDFEPEEVKKGSTLKTASYDFSNKTHSHAIIDTPGSSSFIADTLCALRGADTAILVVGGVSGLRVQGEKAWALVEQEGIARAAFVNELDKERATLAKGLDAIKSALGVTPIAVQIPIGHENELKGVVDLISQKAYLTVGGKTTVSAISDDMKGEVQEARTKLIESVAETDDQLVEKYLDGQEISQDELLSAFNNALASSKILPVFCGSAETGVGAIALVDAIDNYFPSPLERVAYKTESGEVVAVTEDTNAPLAAIVFKTFADPFMGQVSLARIVSGTLHADATVYNSNSESDERVGKLFVQMGKEQKPIDSASTGEIISMVKLKDTKTGHTLCSQGKQVKLKGFDIPESAINYAVAPKSKGDEDKIFSAIEKISIEDPSIRCHRDSSTGEMLISGTGQNHIEITLQKVQRKFKVEMVLSAPKVPYRETITKQAEAQGRHKKQSGGRGQFGDCWLRIRPLKRSEGFVFKNDIFGGSIPKNYIPAVEKGVVETMNEGFLSGFPMVDIECSVYDGSYHAVDSSDMAFKIAAAKGFKLAVEKAGPVLLEPVMKASIVVPEDSTGDIIGDLNSRRGRVLSMDAKGHSTIVHAEVPLAEMLSYDATLRSMTADRGSFHMEFNSYEEVPAHLTEKIIDEVKKQREEKV